MKIELKKSIVYPWLFPLLEPYNAFIVLMGTCVDFTA